MESLRKEMRMKDALAVRSSPSAVSPVEPRSRLRSIRDAYLGTLSPNSRRAYENDLKDFAGHFGEEDGVVALWRLIEGGQGEANGVVLGYKRSLIEKGLAPASINRKLAGIRSAVKLARMGGFVSWEVEVPGEKSKPYRNTKGPGKEGYQRMIGELSGSDKAKDVRDKAILHLLYDLALRRNEVAKLDLKDVDLGAGNLVITGKGRREPETLQLPEETSQALMKWLEKRGTEPGPLFRNYDRVGKVSSDGGRLTPDGIYKMVLAVGGRVGIRTRPHGLRHASITEALSLTNGNLAAVRDFSRHRSYEVLQHYDDNRQSRGSEVAKLVAKAAKVF
jgi:integrase/recombinase XerC